MESFEWGEKSKEVLSEIHPALARVANMALNMGIIDIALVCGKREKKEQNKKYKEGLSEKKFPDSKHNLQPGEKHVDAFDAYPFVNGEVSYNPVHCAVMATLFKVCARLTGIKIRWGGNWDMDAEPVTDQALDDLGHFERVE